MATLEVNLDNPFTAVGGATSTVAVKTAEMEPNNRPIHPGNVNNLVSSGNLNDQVRRVVYSRRGNVLGKGTILKLDQYAKKSPLADGVLRNILLSGAPNFRGVEGEKIYGVGQPTQFGVKTILNHIRFEESKNKTEEDKETKKRRVKWINLREEPVIYINKRPFVLRELEHPTINMATFSGVTSESVEEMESRLKEDLEKEALKYGGNLLVHDEVESQVIPSWEFLDAHSVQTPREVFEEMNEEIDYSRIPVTAEQTIRFNQLDSLTKSLMFLDEEDHIVYNCQMGLGRSTFGMVIALMLRFFNHPEKRNQLLHSKDDSLPPSALLARSPSSNSVSEREEEEFGPVSHFLRLVNRGFYLKTIVDLIIQECGSYYINLKGVIYDTKEEYERRPRSESRVYLSRAANYLERYLTLLVFASFLSSSIHPDENSASILNEEEMKKRKVEMVSNKRFSKWMEERPEIKSMLQGIKQDPSKALFSVNKTISPLKHSVNSMEIIDKGRKGSVLNRKMILKFDSYKFLLGNDEDGKIEGTKSDKNHFNLRECREIQSWGVASCTRTGILHLLNILSSSFRTEKKKKVHWINLREEPVVYINGDAFVLRETTRPFHNLKAYKDILPSRLENLEERFKSEVNDEVKFFNGKILIHSEVGERQAKGIWQSVDSKTLQKKEDEQSVDYQIYSPLEMFSTTFSEFNSQRKTEGKEEIELNYSRIPVAVGKCPTIEDLDRLIQLLTQIEAEKEKDEIQVVFNCQMGRGRSTFAMIVYLLFAKWKNDEFKKKNSKKISARKYEYYSVLHLMRVISDGQERRKQVDEAIEECGEIYNLREKMEEVREKYEQSRTAEEITWRCKSLLSFIQRYVILVLLNAYFAEQSSSLVSDKKCKITFREFLEERPEIETILEEMRADPKKSTKILKDVGASDPTSRIKLLENDFDSPSEEMVAKVVSERRGDVLDPTTVLKSDHFPGCQKMSLLPHLPGAPNFRNVEGFHVYGTAIPTTQGMVSVLNHLKEDEGSTPKERRSAEQEAKSKNSIWISLREEPVVYINGRPFVLRTLDNMFANLEYTGIDTLRVEEMENRLRRDILNDAAKYGGRMLIHDENNDGSVLATFEKVDENSVQTPRQAYEKLKEEGYHVDFHRIAVTDEQAPEIKDFDDIVQKIIHANLSESHVILNCQMGRGRTTTAMIIATLMAMLYKNELTNVSKRAVSSKGQISLRKSVEDMNASPVYSQGEFKIILRLMRVLKGGVEWKELADFVIDHCDHMQNLRQDIVPQKDKAESNDPKVSDSARRAAKIRGEGYLKRYFFLIVFGAYIGEQQPLDPDQRFKTSFEEWMNNHQELYSLLETLDLS